MKHPLRYLPIAGIVLTGAALVSGTNPAQAAAASQPVVSQACLSGQVTATFSWDGVSANAKEVWLDLSLFDNGWQDHSFMSAGPMTASSVSYSWIGLPSKVPFYTRVSQLMSDGSWSTSGNTKFSSMDCAADSSSSSSSTSSSSSSSPSLAAANTGGSGSSSSSSGSSAVPPPIGSGTSSGGSSSASASSATATPSPSPTPKATATPKLPTFTLFSSEIPRGYDDLRPQGTIGYFLPATGADLAALKASITVTMVGPGGAVTKSSNPSNNGWNWDTGIPGGLAIWMNPGMPMASYTVTVTLPDGRTASAGFYHFVPSAG